VAAVDPLLALPELGITLPEVSGASPLDLSPLDSSPVDSSSPDPARNPEAEPDPESALWPDVAEAAGDDP
jgi:hypothetical protein